MARAGNPHGRIAFGGVGAADVTDADEVFIIIAPQSMVGASVYEPLSEMVTAANGRPVILINPRLQDRKSAGGVMGVGGRSQRLAFAASFRQVIIYSYIDTCVYTCVCVCVCVCVYV